MRVCKYIQTRMDVCVYMCICVYVGVHIHTYVQYHVKVWKAVVSSFGLQLGRGVSWLRNHHPLACAWLSLPVYCSGLRNLRYVILSLSEEHGTTMLLNNLGPTVGSPHCYASKHTAAGLWQLHGILHGGDVRWLEWGSLRHYTLSELPKVLQKGSFTGVADCNPQDPEVTRPLNISRVSDLFDISSSERLHNAGLSPKSFRSRFFPARRCHMGLFSLKAQNVFYEDFCRRAPAVNEQPTRAHESGGHRRIAQKFGSVLSKK